MLLVGLYFVITCLVSVTRKTFCGL